MPNLYLLGTGAAVSDPHRTTTMLALENEAGTVLVDCGGDALQRLAAAGGDPASVNALIVTHEHADHVGGFPLLMEKIWLYGRREPLPVYGIRQAIEQVRRTHETFDTSDWPGYPAIDFREVAHERNAPVLEEFGWQITATPGDHAVPVIGLRIAAQAGGGVVVYSCDTAYSPAIVELARGADVLVHEATGEGPGHSTALDAARSAREAGVERLLLVHLPPEEQLGEAELSEARGIFSNLEKGEEGGCYPI